MPLTDLVAPNAIIPALKVNGKKQAIQELSARAAKLTGQNERLIFETLMQREKLGSTGVGNGIAIPHGKLPKLEKLVGLFARLDRPIDFEALDGQPVDLIFLLLAPEGAGADHLKALARVARLLREARNGRAPARVARCRRALRGAGDAAVGGGVARLRHAVPGLDPGVDPAIHLDKTSPVIDARLKSAHAKTVGRSRDASCDRTCCCCCACADDLRARRRRRNIPTVPSPSSCRSPPAAAWTCWCGSMPTGSRRASASRWSWKTAPALR